MVVSTIEELPVASRGLERRFIGAIGIGGVSPERGASRGVQETIKSAITGLALRPFGKTREAREAREDTMEDEVPGFRDFERYVWEKYQSGESPVDSLTHGIERFLATAVTRGEITSAQRDSYRQAIFGARDNIVAASLPGKISLRNPPEYDQSSPEGRRAFRMGKFFKGERYPRELAAGLLVIRASVPDCGAGKKPGGLTDQLVGIPVSDEWWTLKSPTTGLKYGDVLSYPDDPSDPRIRETFDEFVHESRDFPNFVNTAFRVQWEDTVAKGGSPMIGLVRRGPKTLNEDLMLYGKRYLQVMDSSLVVHSADSPTAQQRGVGKKHELNFNIDMEDFQQAGGVEGKEVGGILHPLGIIQKIVQRGAGILLTIAGGRFLGGLMQHHVDARSSIFMYGLGLLALGIGIHRTFPLIRNTLSPGKQKIGIISRPYTVIDAEGQQHTVNSFALNFPQLWESDEINRDIGKAKTYKLRPNILLVSDFQNQQIAVTIAPERGSAEHLAHVWEEWGTFWNMVIGHPVTAGLAAFVWGASAMAAEGVSVMNQAGQPPAEVRQAQAEYMAQAAPGLARVYELYPDQSACGEGNVLCLIDQADPRYRSGAQPEDQPYKAVGASHYVKGLDAGAEWAKKKSSVRPSEVVLELFRSGIGLRAEGSFNGAWSLYKKDKVQFVQELNNLISSYAVGFTDEYCIGSGVCVIPAEGGVVLSELVETDSWEGVRDYLLKRVWDGSKLSASEKMAVEILAKQLYEYYRLNQNDPFTPQDADFIFELLDRKCSSLEEEKQTVEGVQSRLSSKTSSVTRAPRELPGERAKQAAYAQRQAQRFVRG